MAPLRHCRRVRLLRGETGSGITPGAHPDAAADAQRGWAVHKHRRDYRDPAQHSSTSNLNFKSIAAGGQDIANLVVVPVGGDDNVRIIANLVVVPAGPGGNVRIDNDQGSTYVIADVSGFFGP